MLTLKLLEGVFTLVQGETEVAKTREEERVAEKDRLWAEPGNWHQPDGEAAGPASAFSIKELSKRSGVSAHTIRYYERVCLLPPAIRRGPGNYRCYTDVDLRRLVFVRRARAVGFSLKETRELLHLRAGDAVQEKSAQTVLQRKITELEALRTRLQEQIAVLQKWLHASKSKLGTPGRSVLDALELVGPKAPAATANKGTRSRKRKAE